MLERSVRPKRVVWKGDEAQKKKVEAVQRGVYKWGEIVLERATRIVPLEEGTLMRSGTVHEPEPGKLSVAITYDTPYAVVQHENLSYHHDPGRQAKYLETPINETQDLGMKIVGDEMKREF